jgi:hypothetical protein
MVIVRLISLVSFGWGLLGVAESAQQEQAFHTAVAAGNVGSVKPVAIAQWLFYALPVVAGFLGVTWPGTEKNGKKATLQDFIESLRDKVIDSEPPKPVPVPVRPKDNPDPRLVDDDEDDELDFDDDDSVSISPDAEVEILIFSNGECLQHLTFDKAVEASVVAPFSVGDRRYDFVLKRVEAGADKCVV